MTNELIEAIPSPLWLITKPGGYKHINQFGRVYRTRELALRHCDVNEMVVELRLAPAPEPFVHPCGYFSCVLPAGHDGVHQFPNRPALKSGEQP